MCASNFKSFHHIYWLGDGKISRITIKNKSISFANDMLGGMRYSGVKVNMKKCSHKEYKVVDQSIQEEANEERDQACEEHRDHKE